MSSRESLLRRHRNKALAAGAALAALGALAFYFRLDRLILPAVEWIRGQGVWGALVFIALYVVGTVAMVPGSVLTLSCGFVYGLLWGEVIVSIAATIGASASFLIGRYLARDWVGDKIADYPRFAAVDRAVGEQGFKVVLLTRLSPFIPYFLLNYALGLTRVRFRDYVAGTWLGMIPVTTLIVYFGTLLTSITEAASKNALPTDAPWLVGGFVVTAVMVALVGRVALRAWKQAIE